MFSSDNGTAKMFSDLATVYGRSISGWKSSMTEGGSRVPLVVNWPDTTPAGKVNNDLTDLSDFFVTIADLAGADLPAGVMLDGRSFAPQIRGEKGSPREWVYVQLGRTSYVRDARFKLTNDGKMFDLSEAPFNEIPIPADTTNSQAVDARRILQAVLDAHPAAPGNPNAKTSSLKKQ
jgi:arylsulfatase A